VIHPYQESITMKVMLKRSTYKSVIYGAGICLVRVEGTRYCGMAVKAGGAKKIVRVMAARKWLIAHGCPAALARKIVSHALQS